MPDSKTKKLRIILLCQGGQGDVIAHTPMIRGMREKYPDDEIIVTCTYAHLFEGLDYIDKVVPLSNPGEFYTKYALDPDHPVRFFKKHFIYDAIMDEPAQGCKTLPEFICSLYGSDYDRGKLDYIVSADEDKIAQVFLSQYQQFNLPIVLLHCTGSIPSEGQPRKVHTMKDLDIEQVTKLVKAHQDKALFIHIGLEGEPTIEGSIDALGMPLREAAALIKHCSTFIFIESIFAHITNALDKKGIVVFRNTSTDFFGYANNHNIAYSGGCPIWPCNRPVGALMDLLPGYRNPKTREPVLWECPDQVCKNMPYEDLEKTFLEVLAEVTHKGADPALQAARSTPPPQIQLPNTAMPMGMASPSNVNVSHHNPPIQHTEEDENDTNED